MIRARLANRHGEADYSEAAGRMEPDCAGWELPLPITARGRIGAVVVKDGIQARVPKLNWYSVVGGTRSGMTEQRQWPAQFRPESVAPNTVGIRYTGKVLCQVEGRLRRWWIGRKSS